MMYNTRVTKYPYVMVFVESTSDVQKAILFARQHNLKISIKSSGHDYIGRSTADMSLQIITKRMKRRTVNISSSRNADGEIIAETGNTWIEVYKEVILLFRILLSKNYFLDLEQLLTKLIFYCNVTKYTSTRSCDSDHSAYSAI